MTAPTGRDGRLLVTTDMAAYSLGMKPASFRGWAVRHQVRPAGRRPNPNGGQAAALWDLADIAQALDQKKTAA
ncbi:hypothetical protein AB0M87_04495 [Streptomyces sp. NPDC051320]|uniref:hypothetical protein n=1 Tax=Streptomyces sp. NPDC051320 TaxID=3154644 RepID=UPI00343DCD51